MEGDLLGLNLSVLNIDLIAYQDNRDVFTNSDQVLVPFGHILIGDSGTHIKHNNSAVSTNAIEKGCVKISEIFRVIILTSSRL